MSKEIKNLTDGEKLILDQLARLEIRLSALEERLEERLPSTDPTWMDILPRIGRLSETKAELLALVQEGNRLPL